MFIKTKHAHSVVTLTLFRAILYIYILPKNGFYKKLKDRFGAASVLFLNTELAVHCALKHTPGRQPGRVVLIDQLIYKRLHRLVTRQGLKPMAFYGQKELLSQLASTRPFMVILSDAYRTMRPRQLKLLNESEAIIFLYQKSKRPKQVEMEHDIYLWEPRGLPRSSGGAVCVVANENMKELPQTLRSMNTAKPRLASHLFIRDIIYALRGLENRYRRIDRRPPKVLARMLYDFYR